MPCDVESRPVGGRHGPWGFSLVELLIVLAVFGLILGTLFSSLQQSHQIAELNRADTELQQNLEDIFSLMADEIRQAGFPPANLYDASYLAQPGIDRNLVARGLLEVGPTALGFDGDINPNDHLANNWRTNYVRYSLSGASSPYALNRVYGEIAPDGSLPGSRPQKLSEQVEQLQFKYFDHQGVETVIPAEVAAIQIQLTLRSKTPDPFSGAARTVSNLVTIRPLNL
jgi:prepilin-type N-terminal cleavage/methylation domain-containing protein